MKPGNWQQGLSEEEIQEKMRERIEEGQQDFRVFRLNYITSVFKCMTPDFEEMVDNKVKKISTPLKRSCEDCKATYSNKKRKCDLCQGKVTKVECVDEEEIAQPGQTIPKYMELGEILNGNSVIVKMLETFLLNPNSFVNLDKILDEIYELLIRSGLKEWVSLGMDGPPYTILRRIIEDKGYDWVALTSGLGHLNMNQLKTFFTVCSSVCFDVLGEEVLNFKTPKALKYFLSCKDTHKSWQSFELKSFFMVQLWSSLECTVMRMQIRCQLAF